MPGSDAGVISAPLDHPVLNGTYYTCDFAAAPTFVPTTLGNAGYASVAGGQRVVAMVVGGKAIFSSGLQATCSVAVAVSLLSLSKIDATRQNVN